MSEQSVPVCSHCGAVLKDMGGVGSVHAYECSNLACPNKEHQNGVKEKTSFDIGLSPNCYWKFSVDMINKYFALDKNGNQELGATMAFNNINPPALDGVVRVFLDQERPRRTDEEFEKFIKFVSRFNRLLVM